jgi:hypothetical protein
MNLWLYGGKASSDGKEVEIVIKSFTFIPPTLSIALAGTSVLLNWPAPFSSFTLYQTDHLPNSPENWSNVPTAPVPVGDSLQVVVPMQTDHPTYFQLRSP